MKKIRLLIADDHALMRVGLKTMLKVQKDMSVVGEAANGEEAVARAEEFRPDVIVMDLVMTGMSGVEAARRIRDAVPETRVVILTSYGTSDELRTAFAEGIAGIQLKGSDPANLLSAIRTVAAGERAIAPEVEVLMEGKPEEPAFSSRQRAILDALVRGLSNDEIAALLNPSRARIKQHLNELYTILGAANRTEAVAIALRRQLLA